MTDLWEDVREGAKHMSKEELYTSLRDVLIDSYALLAVTRAAQRFSLLIEPGNGLNNARLGLDGLDDALASLPEHLRE